MKLDQLLEFRQTSFEPTGFHIDREGYDNVLHYNDPHAKAVIDAVIEDARHHQHVEGWHEAVNLIADGLAHAHTDHEFTREDIDQATQRLKQWVHSNTNKYAHVAGFPHEGPERVVVAYNDKDIPRAA